ncbi:hypothetical protein [Streptomyces sp. WAC06614]|uniref:hypothetical protein n=1 Tax=Streptomyces sp. WAC06614 TaxID=2487416 RepID=UPI000F76F58B|nr:hypothetical protein [Streptomyces sp. WAC06614]RSS61228.1 hypothetical protein EF918_31975 [Streptomyces sp. WAC06614]
MNRHPRRTRTAVVTLIASSFAAGGLAALAPTATAAPALGTCTVKPNAAGTSVTISGSGWTDEQGNDLKASLNDGESTEPLSIQNGSFQVTRFQKADTVDFVVLPEKGGFKNCTVVPSDAAADKDAIRKARQQGFKDGVKAGKEAAQENCRGPKPKPRHHQGLTAQEEAVEKAYEQGFLAGATSAFDKFCKTHH